MKDNMKNMITHMFPKKRIMSTVHSQEIIASNKKHVDIKQVRTHLFNLHPAQLWYIYFSLLHRAKQHMQLDNDQRSSQCWKDGNPQEVVKWLCALSRSNIERMWKNHLQHETFGVNMIPIKVFEHFLNSWSNCEKRQQHKPYKIRIMSWH